MQADGSIILIYILKKYDTVCALDKTHLRRYLEGTPIVCGHDILNTKHETMVSTTSATQNTSRAPFTTIPSLQH